MKIHIFGMWRLVGGCVVPRRVFNFRTASPRTASISPWTWRHCDPPQRRKLLIQWHGVTSQNAWIFSNTAVRVTNVAMAVGVRLHFVTRKHLQQEGKYNTVAVLWEEKTDWSKSGACVTTERNSFGKQVNVTSSSTFGAGYVFALWLKKSNPFKMGNS
jgi:hypothetical protein